MLDDIALGKKVIDAIGKGLTVEEQETLSTYRSYIPSFLSTQDGQGIIQLLGTEFTKYINDNMED